MAMTQTMAVPAARPGEDLHMLAGTISTLQQDLITGMFVFPGKVKVCSSMYIHNTRSVPPLFLLCSALYWQFLDTGTTQYLILHFLLHPLHKKRAGLQEGPVNSPASESNAHISSHRKGHQQGTALFTL